MANRTFAVHTNEELIRRVDQYAEEYRRSRNSLLNEAIEILLDHYDAEALRKAKQYIQPKKAGKR